MRYCCKLRNALSPEKRDMRDCDGKRTNYKRVSYFTGVYRENKLDIKECYKAKMSFESYWGRGCSSYKTNSIT